jgi:lipoyl(octanoyl) transferase
MSRHSSHPLIRHLGLVDYETSYHAMQNFTATRNNQTPDEIWTLQHPPIYTLGVRTKPEHYPRRNNGIPIFKTDRGGQITFHAPGQLTVYTLLDLTRLELTVRSLVRCLEACVIDLLGEFDISATGNPKAPGVYVNDAKIAAVGLRVSRGCCYHGLALNVDMDLAPFKVIDPCGYAGLSVLQAKDLGISTPITKLGERLADILSTRLINRSQTL